MSPRRMSEDEVLETLGITSHALCTWRQGQSEAVKEMLDRNIDFWPRQDGLPSYYLKQLAQEAVADTPGVGRVENQIDVTPPAGPGVARA